MGKEIYSLYKDINSGAYRPGQGRCFIVTKPRTREIWASTFRDRVVHHLIVDPLEKIWEPKFHPKAFACRKGKGLYAAIDDFKKQVRRISQGGNKSVWALQLDIAAFFSTVDREILRNLYLQEVQDEEIARLIELQFKHDPRKNFDHFVSRQLRPKGYLRYMDDLTLLDTDQERLSSYTAVIDNWLMTNRKQKLNPTKTILKPLSQGIDYLGFRLMQTDSPKEPLIILPQAEKKWKLVSEARRLQSQDFTPIMAHEISFYIHHKNRRQLQKINSRLGLFSHTRSYQFRKATLEELRSFFEQQKPDTPFSIQNDYRSVKI